MKINKLVNVKVTRTALVHSTCSIKASYYYYYSHVLSVLFLITVRIQTKLQSLLLGFMAKCVHFKKEHL